LSIHRSLLITRCALANAYPNPFRGNVRIGFDVATVNGRDMQNVEVNVYDLRGTLVRQLVKGMYKTGRYSVLWDGSDRIGSNMYIVMMKTDNFSQKMKLFKVK
jgi:flagellar hook assembly protein FlgD